MLGRIEQDVNTPSYRALHSSEKVRAYARGWALYVTVALK